MRHTNELFDLSIDGEVISTTGEHPFWVPDQGWVKAKDLQIGTLLQTEDGRIIDVDGVARREGDFTVYNLKVDDFHTYYVSDLEILVHNANYDPLSSNRIDPASLDISKLTQAANEPFGTGELTKAGRALDKHALGQRTGNSPFPKLSGSNLNKNQVAQQQVDEILNHPDAVFTKLGRGGVQVIIPDGRGLRFNADGSFSGFIS